jgi:hypothetical protein
VAQRPDRPLGVIGGEGVGGQFDLARDGRQGVPQVVADARRELRELIVGAHEFVGVAT